MSYITPEFQLVESADAFISLLFADKKKKTAAGEETVVTEEINDYLVLPHIDTKYKVEKMEQKKFSKNVLHLGTMPDKRKIQIQDDGTITVK